MRHIKLTDDVVPLHELKAKASYWLGHVAKNRRPVLITQNGRPAGVLLDPRDFEETQERARFVEAVNAGIKDADAERFISENELDQMLKDATRKTRK